MCHLHRTSQYSCSQRLFGDWSTPHKEMITHARRGGAL
jgi:hypothetical protein